MIQEEEKELLLVDLCARLPYHLLGKDAFGKTREMKVVYPTGTIIAQEIDGKCCSSCGFIPYLRPMSSMTKEETDEYNKQIDKDTIQIGKVFEMSNACMVGLNALDWLNAHHFDYRGLIEKGLAIEAPEEMYNFK